uniref:Putative ovule protein n=1 Tax=Solanum chacoense TaxID=4108 RepID=A0A0V0GT77_SOLCH
MGLEVLQCIHIQRKCLGIVSTIVLLHCLPYVINCLLLEIAIHLRSYRKKTHKINQANFRVLIRTQKGVRKTTKLTKKINGFSSELKRVFEKR